MDKTLGITGHREFRPGASFDWAYEELESALVRARENGFVNFRTGMAPGADIRGGELAVEAKFSVVGVIPFPGYRETKYFTDEWRDRYDALMIRLAGFVYVTGEGYHMGAAFKLRNEVLVDKCHAMIAIYDGRSRGGTLHTINYTLREKGVPIYRIDPMTQFAKWLMPEKVI